MEVTAQFAVASMIGSPLAGRRESRSGTDLLLVIIHKFTGITSDMITGVWELAVYSTTNTFITLLVIQMPETGELAWLSCWGRLDTRCALLLHLRHPQLLKLPLRLNILPCTIHTVQPRRWRDTVYSVHEKPGAGVATLSQSDLNFYKGFDGRVISFCWWWW